MDREITKEEKRKSLKRLIIRLSAFAIILIVIVISIFRFMEPVLPLKGLVVGIVDRGTIEITVNASGKLVPQNEEVIVSPIQSRVLEVYKNPGETVELGDPLIKLDLSETETEYHKKLDERGKLKSQLAQTKIKLDNRVSDLVMKMQIKEMHVKQLFTDLAGEKRLEDIGASSPDKVQRAQLNYDEAMLELNQLKVMIENERRISDAEMDVMRLDYQIFEKDLAQSAKLLKDAHILSPKKATLSFVLNQIGMQVTQGMQLAVVSDLSRFKVEAEVADSYADRLSLGAKAIVEVGRQQLTGTVIHITPEASGGILKFVVMLDNSDNPLLRSGLKVDVHVLYGVREEVLRIPNGASFKGKGADFLWVIQNGRAEKRNVTLGESSYEYVEVTGGLQVGDQVILSDMSNYKNKQIIKIK